MSLIARCFDNKHQLIAKPSAFSDISFTEIFDKDKLATILADPIKLNSYRRKEARDQVPLDKYLKQFYQLRCKELFEVETNFTYTRNEVLLTREQSTKCSMQGMLREARHFISHGLYTDVDMSNAHPRFILQICKELKIKCTALEQYVQDREQIIKDWIALDPNMTRDSCKTAFIKILYGNKKDLPKAKTAFLKLFAKEVPTIASKIMSKFPEYQLEVTKHRIRNGKNYNLEASGLSYLCQTFEASLLSEMFEILQENTNIADYSKTILAFDGMMIANSCWDNHFTPEKFIQMCHERINLPCFSLEVKDMSVIHDKLVELYKYKQPEDDLVHKVLLNQRQKTLTALRSQKKEGFIHEPQTYVRDFLEDLRKYGTFEDQEILDAYLAANINKYFARLTLCPGQYACNISKESTPMQIMPDQNVSYYSVKASGIAYEMKDLAKYIRGSSVLNKIKLYDAARLHPYTTGKDPTPDGILNTWTGFTAKLVQPVECEITNLWLSHFRDVISAGDESMYQYLMTWLNHIFTKPNKVSRRCLVLYSEEQQVGKGLLSQLLEAIIGDKYYYQHDGLEFLKTNFNGEVEGRIMNVCEELAALANDKVVSDTFKSLITDPKVNIKRKHSTPYNTESYLNFMLITNNLRGINIDVNDERFCVYKVSDCRKNQNDYFIKLLESLDNTQIINNVYSTIVNFKPTMSVLQQPRSETYKLVQDKSMSSSDKFIDMLNSITEEDEEVFEPLMAIATKTPKDSSMMRFRDVPLRAIYKDWCTSQGLNKPFGVTALIESAHRFEKKKGKTLLKVTSSGRSSYIDVANPRFFSDKIQALTLD